MIRVCVVCKTLLSTRQRLFCSNSCWKMYHKQNPTVRAKPRQLLNVLSTRSLITSRLFQRIIHWQLYEHQRRLYSPNSSKSYTLSTSEEYMIKNLEFLRLQLESRIQVQQVRLQRLKFKQLRRKKKIERQTERRRLVE
jgi:hypothetical protein